LFLIPVSATDSAQDADETATACRQDLSVVTDTLRIDCPVWTLICGLEFLAGFPEFVLPLDAETRMLPIGRSFPFLPDLSRDEIANLIEKGVRWISDVVFPAEVYKLLHVETPTTGPKLKVVGDNVQLFRLLSEVRDRQKLLGQILVRGFIQGPAEPAMLGGCYLAGTGLEPSTEQAFVPGVFLRLLQNHELVSWRPEVVAEDESAHRWANFGYTALGIITTLCLCWVGYTVVSQW
jgi:hypothetical protein